MCLSFQCVAANSDDGHVKEKQAITKQSVASVSEVCQSDEQSSLKPGFYIVDNRMYDVLDSAAANAASDKDKSFLPISIVHSTRIKPYIKDTEYHLTLQTTAKGARKLKAFSANNVGNYIALIVDDEVLFSATIMALLSDSFYVTGISSHQEALEIQTKINCALR